MNGVEERVAGRPVRTHAVEIRAGVITVLKQWLQDWLPQLLGQSGNFEIIVFGIAMVLVLQKARAGLWPVILRLLPANAELVFEIQLVSSTPGG